MGQQQLLLLVFSIVMVGGVVVAGAHALEGGKKENNRTLVFQESLAIVADLQSWKLKSTLLGGGTHIDGFAYVTFRTLGYSHTLLSNRVHKTEFACYILETDGEGHHAELSIYAPSCAGHDFVARVVVRGTGPGERDWYHQPGYTLRSLGR